MAGKADFDAQQAIMTMHSSEGEGTYRNGTPPKTAETMVFGETLMRRTNLNIKDMVKDNSAD